jgi:CubicO group peptidase (beta-lactamase class C family)
MPTPARSIAAHVGLIIALIVPSVTRAQRPPRMTSSAPAEWSTFTRAFDEFATADRIVGGATILVRDGHVVAHHEYGFADREAQQRVDERTIFHYGSITKTLCAIAVLQLRDRGRLSLDDRVTSYLPELRQVHTAYGSMDDVTIRMLLSHSSGFQNPTWPYGRGRAWEPFEPTRWEQLVSMMPYQELLFAPGSRYGYSNPAFIYLARIVEQRTGDAWQTYVQKNIFAPLGMTRSYFGVTPYHLAADRSNNYTVRRDGVVPNGREFDPGITIPNGGWNAPLADLATYVAFLTGATHGDAATARRYDLVLPRATLEEMWRPIVPVDPVVSAAGSTGLGFFVHPRTDGASAPLLVGHWGEQAGFRALMYFDPRTTTGIVAVVNTSSDVDGDGSAARWDAVRAELVKRLR